MALVIGRYECLFTRKSHILFVYPKKSYFSRAKPSRNMTSEGKQSNKGHKLFINERLVTRDGQTGLRNHFMSN